MDSPRRSTVAAQGSDTPRERSSGPAPGFYQCGVCKKEHDRADYLIRHVRSHTANKPLSCEMRSLVDDVSGETRPVNGPKDVT
ncbi:hypothetical protein N7524_004701 [Penicillium chrysogenum]|nr:hypothetical protein N7524_004701 [Penicillium chrysogenum]